MTHKEIKGLIIQTTEKIVIDYANFSGREDAHRSEFRQKTEKNIVELYTSLLKEEIKKIEKIDVSGGGNGRRLKEQILAQLQETIKSLEKKRSK